jgi:hypothetical protein
MPDVILAYIDPGSGSLIIQVLIASLIAIPVFFRAQIARLTGFSRRRAEKQATAEDHPDAD